MNKPALPGATGYAPIKDAEFQARQREALALPEITPEWGTPEHSAYMRLLARRSFSMGDAFDIDALDPLNHRGSGNLDHDKMDAIKNNEDYDVFPQQSGC